MFTPPPVIVYVPSRWISLPLIEGAPMSRDCCGGGSDNGTTDTPERVADVATPPMLLVVTTPTYAVAVRPMEVLPSFVHVVPSTEEEAVTVDPMRVRRTHRGGAATT